MLLPASLLLLFVLLLPFYQLRIVNICTTLGAILFGSLLYYVLHVRHWAVWRLTVPQPVQPYLPGPARGLLGQHGKQFAMQHGACMHSCFFSARRER